MTIAMYCHSRISKKQKIQEGHISLEKCYTGIVKNDSRGLLRTVGIPTSICPVRRDILLLLSIFTNIAKAYI